MTFKIKIMQCHVLNIRLILRTCPYANGFDACTGPLYEGQLIRNKFVFLREKIK